MRPRLFIVVVISLVVLGVSCRRAEREQGDFGAVSHSLEELTTPDGGSVERRSQIQRTKVSARVSWEIRASSPWPEYRAWLAEQLGGTSGFHVRSENVTQIVFARELPGDVHSLTVDLLEAGPPVRVRVNLEAAAW